MGRLGRNVCARLVLGSAAVAAGLSVYVLWGFRLQASVLHRLELAYNSLLMWLDHPLMGVGLGGFNHEYPLYQEAHSSMFDGRALHSVWVYAGAVHNEYLQVLVTFGLAGGLILAGLLLLAVMSIKLDWLGLGALVSLAGLAGVSLVGFPFQNATTAIIGVVCLALLGDRIETLGPVRGHIGRWFKFLSQPARDQG